MPSALENDSARIFRFSLAALLALFCLLAAVPQAGALAIDWEAAPIDVAQPGAIATDGAGRIYVPLRGQGRLNIYDNARGGNKLLASIGQGQLVDPISVAIDVRNYIYVADASRNAVIAYSPHYLGAPYLGTSGKPGQALGQFAGLRQIAVDFEPRVYAAEADNGRVQSLDAARGVLTPMFAFGVTDPGAWGPVGGLALDSAQRAVVSSSSPSDPLRLFAPNGGFVGDVVGSGSGPGQVSAPQALNFDSTDRLLVADTGNNRVQVFSSIPSGLTPQGSFGSLGAGVGQFNQPGSVAAAPGALLYVSDFGNDRIVRLRYDDDDADGALDATDNCLGLANGSQGDVDSDRLGDACDADIDGDGIGNAGDSCPLVKPFVDQNNDGCQDPFSTLSQLLKGKGKAASIRLSGRASGGSLGISKVEVAIVRAGSSPRFVRAQGTTRWSYAVRRKTLRAGRYRVYVRAVQKRTGTLERRATARASFRIAR